MPSTNRKIVYPIIHSHIDNVNTKSPKNIHHGLIVGFDLSKFERFHINVLKYDKIRNKTISQLSKQLQPNKYHSDKPYVEYCLDINCGKKVDARGYCKGCNTFYPENPEYCNDLALQIGGENEQS